MGIKEFFEKLFKKKGTTELGSASTEMERNHTDERSTSRETKSKEGETMVCVDCGSSFVFLSGEQKFFKMRGLTPPKRCPSCRAKRKQKKSR